MRTPRRRRGEVTASIQQARTGEYTVVLDHAASHTARLPGLARLQRPRTPSCAARCAGRSAHASPPHVSVSPTRPVHPARCAGLRRGRRTEASACAHRRRIAALSSTTPARGSAATRSTDTRLRRGAAPTGPSRSIVLAGGMRQPRQLCAPIERRLFVTRLWYVNPVEPRRALLTGMTRDGHS